MDQTKVPTSRLFITSVVECNKDEIEEVNPTYFLILRSYRNSHCDE